MTQNFKDKEDRVKSHPEWAIDEYVKMSLTLVWFNPPKAPTIPDARIAIKINSPPLKCIIRIKGAIFCQVKIKNAWNQGAVIKTWGNHKWNGATPNLIIRDAEISKDSPENNKKLEEMYLIIKEAIKITEAMAWGKKYLIALSVALLFWFVSSRGIILIKLISSPSQAVSQELAERAMIVPKIKVDKNAVTYGFINI